MPFFDTFVPAAVAGGGGWAIDPGEALSLWLSECLPRVGEQGKDGEALVWVSIPIQLPMDCVLHVYFGVRRKAVRGMYCERGGNAKRREMGHE